MEEQDVTTSLYKYKAPCLMTAKQWKAKQEYKYMRSTNTFSCTDHPSLHHSAARRFRSGIRR